MSEEDRVAAEFNALRGQLARAEESERARIAHELHDDLSQRIAAAALELQLVESRVAGIGESDLVKSFADLRTSVESVAADAHSLSRRLHPMVLDDLGLGRSPCMPARASARVPQSPGNAPDRFHKEPLECLVRPVACTPLLQTVDLDQAHRVNVWIPQSDRALERWVAIEE